MDCEDKTKEQLINELTELQKRVAELEASKTEFNCAEEMLRKSENRHKILLENLPQKIFHKDRNSVYVSCNDNYARDLKINPDQIIGKTDYDFYSKELAKKYRADDMRIMESGNTKTVDEKYIQDGKEMIVRTVKTPVKNERGNIVGILGIFWDITERKRAEEVLRKTKDHLDNIIESSLDSIIVTDDMGYITRVNPSFLQLLGYRKEEMIGNHIIDCAPMEEGYYESTAGELIHINEKFYDSIKNSMNKLLKDGKVINRETYYFTKDKKVVPVEDSLVFLSNDKGERIGAVGIARDITERRKAEKEIKESRDFLENVFKTSADGIMVTDQQSYITMVNEAVEKMLGYSKDELIGKHTRELSPKGKKYEERTKEFISELSAKGIITEFEHNWLRKDGSLIDIEISVALLKDGGGNTIGSVGSIRDITERKKAEEALNKVGHRVGVWVILYLFEHTGEDFQSEIFLVA
jgi:PAS domain S-box-containing protein